MGSKTDEILIAIRADNAELKAKLGDVEKSVRKFGSTVDDQSKKQKKAWGRIGGYVKTAVGVMVAKLSVDAVRALSHLAGELDTVGTTFENMVTGAGKSSNNLLKAMKEATAGTISQLDMMKTANLAMGLMGEQVIDMLPEMGRIARASARLQGVEVSKMFNDLVTASGRQSIMILDNLGISSVTAAKYQVEYAKSLGKTRAQLDESEKAAAFFYAVTKAGGDIVKRAGIEELTLGERMQIMNSRAKNAASTFTQDLVPGVETFLEVLTDTDGAEDNIVTVIADALGDVLILFSRAIIQMQAFGAMWDQFKRDIKGTGNKDARKAFETQIGGMSVAKQLQYLRKNKTYMKEIGYGDDYIMYSEKLLAAQAKYSSNRTGARKYGRGASRAGKAGDTAGSGGTVSGAVETPEDMNTRMETLLEELNEYFAQAADGWNASFRVMTDAMDGFGDANRQMVYDTLWDKKNGWKNWQKNMGEILKRFVADIIYATVKVLALRAAMSIFGGGFGGGFGGAALSSGLGAVLEKGRVPVHQKGRIPAYPGGRVPQDHYLAYIGSHEAVMTKEATRANADILRAMNQNNGQRLPATQAQQPITVAIDGKELFRINDKYQADREYLTGTQVYSRKGVY